MTENAKAYAGALYSLALESGNTKELLEEIKVLGDAFSENPGFVSLLSTPALTREERIKIIDDSFKGKLAPYLLNFIKVLTEYGDILEYQDCFKEYRNQYNWDNNIEEVTVITALPLDEKMEKELLEKLRSLHGKTVVLTKKVDPSLIGGVRLMMEGRQLDGSIQHKLDAIRQKVLGVIA